MRCLIYAKITTTSHLVKQLRGDRKRQRDGPLYEAHLVDLAMSLLASVTIDCFGLWTGLVCLVREAALVLDMIISSGGTDEGCLRALDLWQGAAHLHSARS